MKDINFSPAKGINLIYGDNAQGKTSLIEAIRLMSTGKSFLTSSFKELVNFDKESSFLKVNFIKEKLKQSMTVGFNRELKKKYTLNGVVIPSVSRLIGNMDTVLITPYDLDIVNGSPEVKRRFLDILLCQAMPEYLQEIKIYNRVLKQRNALLKKNHFHKKDINPWTDELIRSGTIIIRERQKAVKEISAFADNFLQEIAESKESLTTKYTTINISDNNIQNSFRKLLENNLELEQQYRYTLFGPHRDSINFFINNINLKKYGSRGQHKSVALSLKFAETKLLTQKKGYTPVILVDDIMNELDLNRQNKLWNYLAQMPQVFITSPENKSSVTTDSKINKIKIANGNIIKL